MAFYSNGVNVADTLVPALMFSDNPILSCGYNGYGQLGINSTTDQSSFQTAPSITNVKQVSAGYAHTVALKTDGTLISCGYNLYGQLGIGSLISKTTFQPNTQFTNVKQVSCGYAHTVALKTDGTLISCGSNSNGQLGINSTTTSKYSSFQTVPSITNVKQVSAGYAHTVALKTDGTLISCGYNNNGQLGLNSTTSSSYSVFQTVPSITNVKQVACGGHTVNGHTVALKTDGTLISCGYNLYGQLGLNSTTQQSSFQTVPSITNVKQVAAGDTHTVAVKNDGTLISCGNNNYGQLGISVNGGIRSLFVSVPSVVNVKQVACGQSHTVALKTDGTLISVGYNAQGQLGINSTTTSKYSSFQTVPSITNVKQIACSKNNTSILQQII